MSCLLPEVAELKSQRFGELQCRLAELSSRWRTVSDWPGDSLDACRDAGVFRWFHATEVGGSQWDECRVLQGYRDLASCCLTTAFVLTQRTAACQRIERATHPGPRERWLRDLVAGKIFATVGISHLTTSRRHVAPTLVATRETGGWRWSGVSPWVTGGLHADLFVLGATLDDGRQLLAAIPRDRCGIEVDQPWELLALSASGTGPIRLQDVRVEDSEILFGPIHDVMRQGAGGGTGGLATSALALGLAQAAAGWLHRESLLRAELSEVSRAFADRILALESRLQRLLAEPDTDDPSRIRREANDLVLGATQASLVAAKGTGFQADHPVGRWAREALFFLVWSCPQGVLQAHLCDWAGLSDQ